MNVPPVVLLLLPVPEAVLLYTAWCRSLLWMSSTRSPSPNDESPGVRPQVLHGTCFSMAWDSYGRLTKVAATYREEVEVNY
ncbi:hypothetical protein K466DRAFT_589742 [Polyporus arcularius HHB13444]|uniref:Uncharacterized protein n=1 Tax=Polyporus arcularius HHB13444 TaxID=1314778 RepID=A0A5C3P198_9APHY|nr:hypothetical protein K466DRAFT_589742 [Polyporus arcularius HHB13444]